MNQKELAKMIDHTLLKADALEDQVKELCREAKEYDFASVCVNPSYVSLCAKELKDSEVKVCTVIGFPLGATTTEAKAYEAKDAIEKGAQEVDMVINIGKLKDKDYAYVQKDIEEVVKVAKEKGALTKVIIETCLLTREEKVVACKLSKEAGADFVKTSTGFSTGGATLEDIKLMRETVGPDLGVKASGGVRSYEDAVSLIKAGATRIGASASIAICQGLESDSSY